MASSAKPAPITVVAHDPADRVGKLRHIGGSTSDTFNSVLANSVVNTLWLKNSNQAEKDKQLSAAVTALIGIAPRDEIEGMLAGQLVAANAAAMECYRRAMLGEQTFEGRKENLAQANKLSRTYATLLEALNRHRGKGQQKVTVEHVHVHAGGQAVVGTVEAGGGVASDNQRQVHAKPIVDAPEPALRSQDTNGSKDAVPVASDGERSLPHARRSVNGGTEG